MRKYMIFSAKPAGRRSRRFLCAADWLQLVKRDADSFIKRNLQNIVDLAGAGVALAVGADRS